MGECRNPKIRALTCKCMFNKVCVYTHTHTLSHVLFHSRLLQGTEYTSLFHTVGVFCLFRTLTSNHPHLESCWHDYSSLETVYSSTLTSGLWTLWLPISFVSYVGIPVNFKEAWISFLTCPQPLYPLYPSLSTPLSLFSPPDLLKEFAAFADSSDFLQVHSRRISFSAPSCETAVAAVAASHSGHVALSPS